VRPGERGPVPALGDEQLRHGVLLPSGAARQLDKHDHPGEQAAIAMMGATAAHLLDASLTAGSTSSCPWR